MPILMVMNNQTHYQGLATELQLVTFKQQFGLDILKTFPVVHTFYLSANASQTYTKL